MNDKERFISIMKRIKIGDTIIYKEQYQYDEKDEIKIGKVKSISPCSCGIHEACKYCVGYINVVGTHNCFKLSNSWYCRIVDIIETNFIKEEEMMI